jgi:hypothetical protein
MSEIRSFETVEIESPRLPTIGLSEVIACKDAHRINSPNRTTLRSRRAILSAMANSATFESAHAALVSGSMRLDPAQITSLRPQMDHAIRNGDFKALVAATQQLVLREERREAATALQILSEAAHTLQFKLAAFQPERGLIQMTTGRGRETITVEVSHGKDGRLRMVSDTDGFHAENCVATTTRLFDAAHRLGLKTIVGGSQRKRPGGVRSGSGKNIQSIGG